MAGDDRRTLGAAFGRILPDDESGPGAVAAGAVEFAELAFRDGLYRSDMRRIMLGLPLLDECAFAMAGTRFADANVADQDAVLARVREIPHPTAVRFLVSLVRVCLAGFLCAPSHGGNKNGCGWSHIGYSPHQRSAGSRRDTQDAEQ